MPLFVNLVLGESPLDGGLTLMRLTVAVGPGLACGQWVSFTDETGGRLSLNAFADNPGGNPLLDGTEKDIAERRLAITGIPRRFALSRLDNWIAAMESQHRNKDWALTFTEMFNEHGITEFTFTAGQTCFSSNDETHRVLLDREAFYAVQRGDWRQRIGQKLTHASPDSWVDDFGTHQDQLARRQ